MYFEFVFSAILGALLYYSYFASRYHKKKRYTDTLQKFPGPLEIPVIGSGYKLMGPTDDIPLMLQGLRKTFGSRYRLQLGSQLTFFLHDPDDVERVLQTPFKSRLNNALKLWLGNAVLVTNGPKWHQDRKMLTPAFHFKTLHNFIPCMNRSTLKFVQLIRRDAGDGREIDVAPYMSRLTLDILCSTAMGTETNAQTQSDSPYLNTLLRVVQLIIYITVRPWMQRIWLYLPKGRELMSHVKILHQFTDEVIRTRKAARLHHTLENSRLTETEQTEDGSTINSKSKGLALLDSLLDIQETGGEGDSKGFPLSDKDIREQIDTFMFAGHDTTKGTILWNLLYIGSHPEVQKKVQEETDCILGNDPNRTIQSSDLPELKYLEQCIKETMRIQAPIFLVMRSVTTDLTLGDGTVLPAGSNAVPVIRDIHKDEKLYPNPQTYDPDRFTIENSTGRHPYAYLPFAAGPRNCIGQKFALMEMKIVLATIFRNFTVHAPSPQLVKPAFRIGTEPADGLRLRFTDRYPCLTTP